MEGSPSRELVRAEHRAYVLEILLGILLGLATVGAAYAAYQASRYDGNTLGAYTEALVKTNETNAAEMKAFQQLTLDMLSYNQFKALRLNIAQVVGKENKVKAWAIADIYLDENLTGTFNKAVRWSVEKDEEEEIFISPAKYEPYVKELESAPLKSKNERDAALKKAQILGNLGDQYTLLTVLFAIVLFFSGIAAVFKREPVKITLLVTASVLMVITLTRLVMLPAA
jgi:hypothetical protein